MDVDSYSCRNNVSREELGPKQERFAELLTLLIDEYEIRCPIRKATPQQTLQHLMEARGLTQKDLRDVFGSKGNAFEVIDGKRAISKTQSKRLAEILSRPTGVCSPELGCLGEGREYLAIPPAATP